MLLSIVLLLCCVYEEVSPNLVRSATRTQTSTLKDDGMRTVRRKMRTLSNSAESRVVRSTSASCLIFIFSARRFNSEVNVCTRFQCYSVKKHGKRRESTRDEPCSSSWTGNDFCSQLSNSSTTANAMAICTTFPKHDAMKGCKWRLLVTWCNLVVALDRSIPLPWIAAG